MFKVRICLSVLIMVANFGFAAEREDTICGWFKERFMFALWSALAPTPDESRILGNPLISAVSFRTTDNKTLYGYQYRAQHKLGENAKGYLLMALGNAMIADQMINYLELFSLRGYDAYIYDYRGYGRSEGKRRINAIIEDYNELVTHLNSKYEKHLLYGVSLGGAVIVNVLGNGLHYDRAVIDSSPSRFSPYGCPDRIDPVNNIPEDTSGLLVITGAIDSVLGPDITTELREVAVEKGATGFNGVNYNHPYMDTDERIHIERLERIISFLTDSS